MKTGQVTTYPKNISKMPIGAVAAYASILLKKEANKVKKAFGISRLEVKCEVTEDSALHMISRPETHITAHGKLTYGKSSEVEVYIYFNALHNGEAFIFTWRGMRISILGSPSESAECYDSENYSQRVGAFLSSLKNAIKQDKSTAK